MTAMELIRVIRLLWGGVMVCRATGPKKFEITMSSGARKEKLIDGFKIGNTRVQGKTIANDEMVVSFLGLPAYVTDGEILEKLEG